MYRSAASALGLDLARSCYVGDRIGDILPALELGGRGILVRTGYGAREEADLPEGIHVAEDLLDAAAWILGGSREPLPSVGGAA
jgi:D-glycero-D-manno-heptose 1,7-bisphosphate phosphatase